MFQKKTLCPLELWSPMSGYNIQYRPFGRWGWLWVVLVGSGRLGKYIFRYSDALPAAARRSKIEVPSQRGVNTAVQQRQQHEMACFWGGGQREDPFRRSRTSSRQTANKGCQRRGGPKPTRWQAKLLFAV